jgi:jumonji domain-containing protein 2
MVVKTPIEQNAYGKGGIYECLHVPKKSVTIEEYRRKVTETEAMVRGKTID